MNTQTEISHEYCQLHLDKNKDEKEEKTLQHVRSQRKTFLQTNTQVLMYDT